RFIFFFSTTEDKNILISYKINKGTATTNCKKMSGGVRTAPTINKIKYAYLRILRKKSGLTIPKLVKNIIIIGISKINANGIVILNKNRKYFSTVNNSLNIPSFSDNKNGRINLINNIYPKTSPRINNIKTAGTYESEILLSVLENAAIINNHKCKLRTGKVPINPIMADIVIQIQIISPRLVTVNLKSISLSKKPSISLMKTNPIMKNNTKNTPVTINRFLNSAK